MTTTPISSLLDELIAADAQGERALMTLWPGDEFYYQGTWHHIDVLQWHSDRRQLFVVTDEAVGDPYPLTTMDKEEVLWQPRRTFLFNGSLIFPAMLSDEHADAERSDLETW